jgi:DNA-binding PadR family transcriptional regulator
MARLTPTSYAVLALLARCPYSAYDLTSELRTTLSYCMPRSSTLVNREPKNLVAHGFVDVEIQKKGRQKSAMYSITPDGRKALYGWLASPPAPPVFESEALVRVAFAHLGPREDLMAALETLENQVRDLAEVGFGGYGGCSERFPPPTEHLADEQLIAELYVDLHLLLIDWSRRARHAILGRPEAWPEDAQDEAWARFEWVLTRAPVALPRWRFRRAYYPKRFSGFDKPLARLSGSTGAAGHRQLVRSQ